MQMTRLFDYCNGTLDDTDSLDGVLGKETPGNGGDVTVQSRHHCQGRHAANADEVQTCRNYRKHSQIAQSEGENIVCRLHFYKPFAVSEIIYTVKVARLAHMRSKSVPSCEICTGIQSS